MITQKELKELLNYDKGKGVFIWIKPTRYRTSVGEKAGSVHKQCREVVIGIKGNAYKAHRLAWLYEYGYFPKFQIDHINHNRLDNRIKNLREVTDAENKKNKPMQINNSSGFTGVCWDRQCSKWRARIYANGKEKVLGVFKDINDAIDARKTAKIKYSYHINHS